MTQVLERQYTPTTPHGADEIHATIQQQLAELGPRPEAELGLVRPELVELANTGRHRLLVINEAMQPTGAFKANGFAVAVQAALARNPDIQTFYTGTAGNAGAAIAWAAQTAGKHAKLLTPSALTPVKRFNMEQYGGAVDASYGDVSEAIEAAELEAATDRYGMFLSPFDTVDAIAGQALVGQRIRQGLLARSVTGPVEVLIQRGGGSLLAGVASALQGIALSNLRVHDVRPELTEDGKLDPLYDGLAVVQPGMYAREILNDPRFVHNHLTVSRADVGRAALRVARSKEFLGERFEPSGLVGVGAFEQLAAQTTTPTTYVTVLSGSNTSAEIFATLADAPRAAAEYVLRTLGTVSMHEQQRSSDTHCTLVASSPVAQFRAKM